MVSSELCVRIGQEPFRKERVAEFYMTIRVLRDPIVRFASVVE